MEEKEKKANATEEEVEKDEDDILDPDDFDDEDESSEEDEESEKEEDKEESDEDEESEEDKKEKEEKAKNAKAAERRRKREQAKKDRDAREAKIREEAAVQAELGILKVNPFTDEPIVDAEDLKIYKIQKQLDDEGKDPINDLPKRLAELARQETKKAKEQEENAQKEQKARADKINAEIKELVTKYPNVNTAELANDPLFQKCLEGRAGRWSQVEIYELYLREKSQAEKQAEDEKKKDTVEKNAKKMSNPPSSNSNGSTPSQKEVDEMTPEEFERYFEEKYS